MAAVAVDGSQRVYVIGATTSGDFPTANAVQPANAGSQDAFVAKVIPSTAVSVTASDPSASETGPDPGTFTITRSGDVSAALSVSYSIGGSALGRDYAGLTRGAGTVTFTPGQSTTTLTLTPVDDTEVEGPETVVLTLTAAAGYTLGSGNEATVTIADNDIEVTIGASDPSASEIGPDPGEFTVYRSGDLSAALTMNYTVGGRPRRPTTSRR